MSQVQVLQGEPLYNDWFIERVIWFEIIASRFVASLGGPVKSYRGRHILNDWFVERVIGLRLSLRDSEQATQSVPP